MHIAVRNPFRKLALVTIARLAWASPATATEPPPTYAAMVQAALQKTAGSYGSKFLGEPIKGAAAVVEVAIAADGSVLSTRLGHSSGKNRVDDWAQGLVLESEPFPPPPAAAGPQQDCLLRVAAVAAGKRLVPDTQVACLAANQVTGELAGVLPPGADDAGARLLAGWVKENSGNMAAAAQLYQQAVTAAPQWDLAARALGLALVRGKRAPDAIPYLKLYVARRGGAPDAAIYAREIKRFEAPRGVLGQQDITYGVRKGYALLEPCLKQAREKHTLAAGVDQLVVSFSIAPDGKVRASHVDGPQGLLLTEQATCIEQAMEGWQFPAFTDQPEMRINRLPLRVRGAAAPPVAVASAAPGVPAGAEGADHGAAPSDEAIDEPTFSTCQRTPEEISRYIRAHGAAVDACIAAEKQRSPQEGLPESLPLAFVVDVDGSVRNIRITHRFYRTGPLADCVTTALAGHLAPSGGADCPADFVLNLGR